MDENKWKLIVEGSYEIIGEEGYPVDSIEYETYFFFNELESLLDFISIHQENAIQYHRYSISFD